MFAKLLLILGLIMTLPFAYVLFFGGHSIVALAALMLSLLGGVFLGLGVIIHLVTRKKTTA